MARTSTTTGMAMTPRPVAWASNQPPTFTDRESGDGGGARGEAGISKEYKTYFPPTSEKEYVLYSMTDRAHRLRLARLESGFDTARAAAQAHGWISSTYTSNENGNSTFSFRRAKEYAAAFGVRAEWLYDASGPMKGQAERLTSVVGRVGADPDGQVLFATGQGTGDLVPLPPGGTEKAVALQVVGHSMPGLADDGALIYFEDQRTPPTSDMLGHVVVVELDTDEVLVKRLLRGSKPRRYDLESFEGPTRHDVKIRWAAHITAIIPPFQARRIIRSSAG
jgi:phage repressor protein C with HTH and peptisase S24 domain